MKTQRRAPIAEYPRYLGIFLRQSMANFEYLYFWLIGVLLHLTLIGSPNPIVWALVAMVDLHIGIAAIVSIVRPVDKAFETLGLDYSIGYGYPRWIVEGKYPAAQDSLKLKAAGYGESDFAKHLEQISSRLNLPIRAIKKPSPQHGIIEVVIKRSSLSRTLAFSDLSPSGLKQGEFFIGQSDDEMETMTLAKMIHMLVAGQTGYGKTQYIKQLIATILSHTRWSHVCVIDMKGGIDFTSFQDLPNFEISADYAAADTMLDAVTRLFEARRDHLLKKKKAQWHELSLKDVEQEKAFKGRPIGPVLLVVDEVAELSKKATENAAKSDLQEKIASLARLARFTGIHLVLGTQRPSKDVISMQSKDNLPTRICFTVPSVAASTLVIGDMMATTLGGIPGRAVFQAGASKIVQTPLIENADLEALMTPLQEKLKTLNYNRTVLQSPTITTQTEQAPEVIV